jgi:hypothetical protein
MKAFRHAAALALVGWYLLAPPLGPNKEARSAAPLKEWANFGSYDTAKECTDDRANQVQFWMSDAAKNSQYKRGTLAELAHSVCIASDDPRLKGN